LIKYRSEKTFRKLSWQESEVYVSDIAISVESVSKVYRIGMRKKHDSFREMVSDWFFSRFRRLTGKSLLDENAEDTIWALKDVSFEVKRGEILGIIGKNGSGKSTLLKILSRITEPTKGCAELKGRVASLLEVGTGFHPELTGRENTYLNGAILGMKRAEIKSKFDEIVAFAEIEKFIDTPVKRYSSGMFVRLAFAVAAHLQPEILLVDEVLAVGDVAFQKKCLGKMEDVTKGGRTVLFVSHSMASVGAICGRAILLESGQITFSGNVSDVISKYLQVHSDRDPHGEESWDKPENAPGDDEIKIKAVRVSSNGKVVSQSTLSDNIDIEIDYWTLKPDAKAFFYLRIDTPLGVFVLMSANTPSISLELDPWSEHPYPVGVFRTICRVPRNLLNTGLYSLSVFCCYDSIHNKRATLRHVLSFTIVDDGKMRKEYQGPWEAVIRPRLAWRTTQLE
jgi:lipopolysaccharide transport system ATP-binding protein